MTFIVLNINLNQQNNMITSIIFVLIVTTIVATLWARGINNSMNNYPDYKGEDLFNEEEEN